MQGFELGEEFAETFKQSMEAQTAQLAAAPAAVVVDPEESLKQAQEMFADDPGMLAYVERVISEIDVEDIDTDQEDHIYDETRYALCTRMISAPRPAMMNQICSDGSSKWRTRRVVPIRPTM